MLFLFQAEKMTKVLVLSVAFFFVGVASINAQYLGADEATSILKSEIGVLEDNMSNATSNTNREDIAFKYKYYSSVLLDIHSGNEVGTAIQENVPVNKPRVHSSGLVEFTSDVPNFKQEVAALVTGLENLLSE